MTRRGNSAPHRRHPVHHDPRCLKCDTEASYHLFVSRFEQQRVSPLHIDARRGEEASLSSHSLPFEGGEGCPVLLTSIAARCEEGHSFSSHPLPFDTRRGGLSTSSHPFAVGGKSLTLLVAIVPCNATRREGSFLAASDVFFRSICVSF